MGNHKHEVDWDTFCDVVNSHDPPLVFTEYRLDNTGLLTDEMSEATQHVREHKNPDTGNVVAMLDAPIDFHGNDVYADTKYYVFNDTL